MRYIFIALCLSAIFGCEMTPKSKCSKLANGMLCRYGKLYGPNVGGVYPNPPGEMKDPVVATCNVADGEPIPCGDEQQEENK